MKACSRAVLATGVGLLLACTAAAQAWAPSKPVRIIVPIVGTTNDVVARTVAAKLQDLIGQPVIVENKPGAGGNIGADLVAKSPPDGHTLLLGYNGPMAANVALFEKIPYDPAKDFAPITLAAVSPQYLVVNPAVPVNSVSELVSWAKANPGKLSYASVAVGSASHLTMEMLKSAARMEATHIPYRGGEAVTAIVAGHVQAAFLVPGNVQQLVKEGRLKLIATSGQKRFQRTPDVPTLIESGYPDFVATVWLGFLAPAGTPRNIIDRYHKDIVSILKMPDVRDKLQGMEYEIVAGTPEQFSDWIHAEIPRWGKVIKAAGAKAD